MHQLVASCVIDAADIVAEIKKEGSGPEVLGASEEKEITRSFELEYRGECDDDGMYPLAGEITCKI